MEKGLNKIKRDLKHLLQSQPLAVLDAKLGKGIVDAVFFCGAKAIRNLLFEQCVLPLPSISTIKRILSRNCLTYGRTGYYLGDENGKFK
jgi:hypothetical protein